MGSITVYCAAPGSMSRLPDRSTPRPTHGGTLAIVLCQRIDRIGEHNGRPGFRCTSDSFSFFNRSHSQRLYDDTQAVHVPWSRYSQGAITDVATFIEAATWTIEVRGPRTPAARTGVLPVLPSADRGHEPFTGALEAFASAIGRVRGVEPAHRGLTRKTRPVRQVLAAAGYAEHAGTATTLSPSRPVSCPAMARLSHVPLASAPGAASASFRPSVG